jgi:parvulin-like peptidyl-prolyl isomerase
VDERSYRVATARYLYRWLHRVSTCGATWLAVVGLAACGGSASSTVVVRVGEAAISRAAVDHWMTVLAGGRVGGSSSERRQALKQQALGVLISSDWALGEAADEGLEVSGREIARHGAEKVRTAFPGGEAELHEFQRATGQSGADTVFEAKAELAAAKIRQAVVRKEPRITRAQIVRYYARNKELFVIPERRELQITNRKSAAEVATLRKEIESGRSFAAASQSDTVDRPSESHGGGRADVLEKAIYSAKPNVLTGPVKRRVDYYLFEVTRIKARAYRTLVQVQGTIKRQLASERERRAIAEFAKTWRSKWMARTDCSPGYVVYRCRQYTGPWPHEAPLSLS